MSPGTLCRVFCVVVGPLLLLDGAAGALFAGTAFSLGDQLPHARWNFLFEFNSWHQLLHVLDGAVLSAGALRSDWAPWAALAFGASYAVMAPAGFADGDDVFDLFYSSTRENLVHAMFAIEGVGLGLLALRAARPG
jgi:Domain of unknown function (DUF4383)